MVWLDASGSLGWDKGNANNVAGEGDASRTVVFTIMAMN